MKDRRRDVRSAIKLELEVSSLFKQDHVKIEHLDAPITVVDISRGGIGFHSKSVLPEGYYFNASIQLDSDDDAKLYCVVKIIRATQLEDGTKSYGCEFVGLAPVLADILDDYMKTLTKLD